MLGDSSPTPLPHGAAGAGLRPANVDQMIASNDQESTSPDEEIQQLLDDYLTAWETRDEAAVRLATTGNHVINEYAYTDDSIGAGQLHHRRGRRGALVDCGTEIWLIRKRGLELPSFSSFPLLKDPAANEVVRSYYRSHGWPAWLVATLSSAGASGPKGDACERNDDQATGSAAAYFMINCARPVDFDSAPWMSRRAEPSTRFPSVLL